MINIVSYSTAKGGSGKGGSGGGGSVTNYNTYNGIQPLYLWGNYFDGTSDIEGNLTSNGTIRGNDFIARNSIMANIIDVLSATTEYFKTISIEASGDANISGDTHIHQDLQVDGDANIGGDASIGGNTTISGSTSMTGDLYSGGSARIDDNATIGGNVNISGSTFTEGSSTVHHDMTVGGDGKIYGDAVISGTTTTTDIYSENITNTGTIRTKDLEVTGTAHFFELIIDRIKAAGGAILLTPADGFRVDYVEDVTNGKKLYFRSTDNSGKGIMNMWKVGDQAICQSFNQATVGTQYDVSNKYWWSLVTEVSEQPVQKTVDGETNDYHYITISTQSGYDSENRPYYDGTINVEAGDEVAMLGYRGTDEPQRQSAIYMAAYRSVDLGLTAPHFAEYQGIDDFNLAAHRRSYIDANGAKFVGYLYVDANTSVQDYVTNETTEIRNEFKFDINGLTSKVEHKSRPNIVSNNDWHDQDNTPLYQENDELYEVSGTTECTAYPPVMYLNAGTYTPSIYGYGKFKTIRYGESKNSLENYLPVETMINFDDVWNDLPRSQAIFSAPYDGYYAIGVELMDSSYTGDTEYFDYIEEESSGGTSGNTVQTEIQLSVDDIKVNRTEQSSVQTYPPSYDKVVYKSSNPSAVTVDEYGNITGVGEGNAIIYAYIPEAYSGGYHYLPSEDYKNVQCSASGQTSISVEWPTTMYKGNTYNIHPVISPSDYSGTTTFTSSDPNIATIDSNGVIQVTYYGDVTFTISTETVTVDGYTWVGSSVSHTIEVKEPIQTSVSISLSKNNPYFGETISATTVVQPSGYGLTPILTSTNTNVATIDNNGVITCLDAGETYIQATIEDCTIGGVSFIGSYDSVPLTVNSNIVMRYTTNNNTEISPSSVPGVAYGTYNAQAGYGEFYLKNSNELPAAMFNEDYYYDVQKLQTVTIPSQITKIGMQCFEKTKLTSLTIPSSVTELGNGVCRQVPTLQSLTLGSGITEIPNYAFTHDTGLTSLTIPNNIKKICYGAFYDCTGLTALNLGTSRDCELEEIEGTAFRTIQFNTVTCYAVVPPEILNAFNVQTSAVLYVPAESVEIYKYKNQDTHTTTDWYYIFSGRIYPIQ